MAPQFGKMMWSFVTIGEWGWGGEMEGVGFLPKQRAHPKARALPLDKSHKADLLPLMSQPYKVFILFNLAAAQTMHTSGVA